MMRRNVITAFAVVAVLGALLGVAVMLWYSIGDAPRAAEAAPPAAPHAGYSTEFTFTCTPASNSGFQCAAGGTDSARQTNAALGSGYFRRIRTTSTYINLDFSTFANPIPANRYVRVTRGGNSAAQSMASGTSNYSQYTGYESGFRWTGGAALGNLVQSNTGDVTIEIMQYTAPSAPSGLTGSAGNNSIVLSWTDPDDFTINKWEYSLDGTNWTSMGTSPTLTSYTITSGVSNGSSYTVRVRAANPVGNGTASSVNVTLPANTPTPTPSPCAGSLSASRTTVAWGESSAITLTMSDGSATAVSWSTTAGSLSNQAISGATVTAPGTGAGTMTVTAAITCSGWKTTASVTISVAYAAATPTPTPTPSPCAGTLSASRATVSRGESSDITLAMSAGTLSSVSWSTTAGTLSNQANTGATITAPATGAGSMTITAAMVCQGWLTTASITISVAYAEATPTPTPTPTPSPCAGTLTSSHSLISRSESASLTLSMTAGTLSSVSWSTTAGSLSNQGNTGATITAPGTGAGTITVTASMTCQGWQTTASVTISVAYAAATPTPTPTPTPSPCAGTLSASHATVSRGESSNITLAMSAGTLSSVSWSTTAGTLSNQANTGATITAPGTGAGSMTITAAMVCQGWLTTASITISVAYAEATPTPIAPTPTPTPCQGSLDGGSGTLYTGQSRDLTLNLTGGVLVSAAWTTTAGALSNQSETGVTVTAPDTGAGTIVVSVSVNCGGDSIGFTAAPIAYHALTGWQNDVVPGILFGTAVHGPYDYRANSVTVFQAADANHRWALWANRGTLVCTDPATLTVQTGDQQLAILPCGTGDHYTSEYSVTPAGETAATADLDVYAAANNLTVFGRASSARYFGGQADWTPIGDGLIQGNTRVTFQFVPPGGAWQIWVPAAVAEWGQCPPDVKR